MKCPLCNKDLGMEGRVCSCGWGMSAGGKRRFSGFAVAALILSLVGVFTLLLGWFLAVPLAIKSLFRIRESAGRLRGKGLAVFAILFPPVFYGLIAAVVLRDMPPLEKEFTINDLRSAPVEYNDSFALLGELNERTEETVVVKKEEIEKDGLFEYALVVGKLGHFGSDYGTDANSPDMPEQFEVEWDIPVGLGMGVMDTVYFEMINEHYVEESWKRQYAREFNYIKEHRKVIERLWGNTEKSRKILEKLNGYPEIADLSEARLDYHFGIYNMRSIRELTRYFCMWQISEGRVDEAVNNLILLDSVARKCSLNARGMIMKLVCISMMGHNIKTASLLVNHPNMTDDGMVRIQNHFAGFDKEILSMSNPIIFDIYMTTKDALDRNLVSEIDKPKYRFLYKRNSTLRFARNLTERALEHVEEKEPEYVKIWRFGKQPYFDIEDDEFDFQTALYRGYNAAGYLAMGIMTPAYGRVFKIPERLLEDNRLLVEQINVLRGVEGAGKAEDFRILVNEEESYIYVESRLDKHYSRPRAVWLPISPENVDRFEKR